MFEAMRAALVTGASGGIGRALAVALARPGVALHLSGRDAGRLEATAEAVRGRGGEARTVLLDVRDRDGMAAWVRGAGRLDLALANAGVAVGTGGGVEDAEAARAVFDTNLGGVLNTVQPALAAMLAQDPGADGLRGRIGVVASMAALVPATPGSPAYAASKAAVDAWARATAVAVRPLGVAVTSACPGYVATAMTAANTFAMPGLLGADEAAAVILRAVAAGRARVAFPRWMALGARAVSALPDGARAALMRRVPGSTATAYLLGPGG